ncbi:MAG TPA: M1 family metallopeptidase [Vicinamibacterales bacterium]|nr:M1 family metallopeptidase [Vicinamibacterales bacterium]
MRRALILLFALLTAVPAGAQRLPDLVRPEHYSLWFAPDLNAETFRGKATIRVVLGSPADVITLNAVDITFGQVSIAAAGRTQTGRVSVNPAAQTATITVPESIPAGQATIEIVYTGILNDKLRGFYISRAHGRKYALTQMEATDARRAFPSFDEPSYKATFGIALQIDRRDSAISNGALVSDRPGPEPGTHTLTFATTPRMSTYLVAMVVGDFVCRSGSSDGTRIRVCSTPDKRGQTGFALEAAQHQIKFYNDYFGIKYPFGKLDIVGVPDFAAGAMENAGAILFRERLLLVDPAGASPAARKEVAGIIAHEIAHQWFGNLVTMKWWDDIWLNEGFASWIGSKPLAAWRPDWRVALDEVSDTQATLATDALRSTRAIHTRADTPEEIDALFDAIAYGKTAAVLRMIESYVGATPFRNGIRAYLRKYAYGNATGQDFWTEMTRVTGKPVDAILKSFVEQPGAPVLSIENRCHGGAGDLTVTQDRFLASPSSTPPAQTWTLPVCVRPTSGQPRCEMVERRQQSMAATSCAVFANAEGRGYYLTEYSPDQIRALTGDMARLTPPERVALAGDEWWMVASGRHDVDVYLSLVPSLARDTVPTLIQALAERLAFTASELVAADGRSRFEQWTRTQFDPALDALDRGRADASDEATQHRHATLLTLVGVTGNDVSLQRRAVGIATAYLDGMPPPPALAQAWLQVAAAAGDAALHGRYVAHLEKLANQPEEYYRFLTALPWFRDPALAERTLNLALSPQIRSQDVAPLIAGVIERPWSRDVGWAFVRKQWPALVERLGTFQGLPGIVMSLGHFCSQERAAEVRQFFAANPVTSSERGLQQALERIETCAAIRARQAPALSRWLRSAEP